MIKEDRKIHKKLDLKRKVFARGQKSKFKRFKKTPKYAKDNPENKVAREKERDAYHFTDSEDEPDDLGMGLDISDLPFMDDNCSGKETQLIALTQDSVRPLFSSEADFDMNKLEEGLAELKYSSFRPNQMETIKRILQGRSTLLISPTGSGKSLCYQLPALLYWRYRKYMTIVVSPLISLMEDQIANFPSALRAVCLHSGRNLDQRRKSIEQLVNGTAQVVFISPEAIVGGLLSLDELKNLPPVGFVCIDEAHCLSEWSHNFRPAYLQFFKILNEQMNIKTYLGLTATATKTTSFAIARNLIINPETDVIGCTTIPDNLILSVSYERNKEKALIDLLKTQTFRIMPSIIVYCNRREDTERVASKIRTAMQAYSSLVEVPERTKRSKVSKSMDDSVRSNGSNDSTSSDKAHMKLSWHAECYHAGLSADTRKSIQRQFIKGDIRVVVATVAFGMGINKANIRAIIHYDMPGSFESYVQEIGRAGRDGKPAQCHMFLKADKTDLYYQQRNIYASTTERDHLEKLIDYIFPLEKSNLCSHLCYATQEVIDKLEKLNQIDKHEVKSAHKTKFTDTLEQDDDPDDEDDFYCANIDGKENRPIKYVHKSLVKKHRRCTGHPVAFDVDEAVNAINLWPETIITLICKLQQAYPQLQLKQYTPIKSTCNLLCYHGPAQLEELKKTSPPVATGFHFFKKQQIKANGSFGEMPNRISFNVIKVASHLGGRSYDEIVRMLKKTEWELVEKTGRFRRSQVRVTFEGNSFYLRAVSDLDEKERKELVDFLFDSTRLYENIEREKSSRMFNMLKAHSIDVDKMENKDSRLETSSKLKAALNAYFNPTLAYQQSTLSINCESRNHQSNGADNNQLDSAGEIEELSEAKEKAIRKDARAFLSAHGLQTKFTPLTIARIFQGISTPNYPAEHWGPNRRWWRIHLDVDFLQMTPIIQQEIISFNLIQSNNAR